MINDVILVLIVIGLAWALVISVQSAIGLVHEFIAWRREEKQQQEVER